jgi:hypothetical protein
MTFRRALILILVVATALFAALSGCAGAGVCFRNSDCFSDYTCHSGACAPNQADDGGEAGSADADASQTPDAN